MALAYTKEFLVDAFVNRYKSLKPEFVERQLKLANTYYDTHGKDQFRVAASLDADALKKYKLELKGK